ncbi:hypothetical protein SORBI_3001G352100, partial [Sorghum bicolor]
MSIGCLAAVVLLLSLLHLQIAPADAGDDAAALLGFKHASVAVDQRGVLVGWVNDTSSSSPCTWTGISCADGLRQGCLFRNLKKNLSGMSLAGRLSLDSLLELPPRLKSLDLSNNRFYGNLSASDHTLFRPCVLEDMDLSSNSLDGTLPSAFLASCGALEFLNISRNSLTAVGFPFPPSLRTFDLSNNQLSDAGLLNYTFTSCGHSVQYLDLSANQFAGGIPATAIAPCSKLAVLDLSSNLLSGALPADLVAAAPATMTHLSIARNNLSGDISAYEFGVRLNLAGNRFSGEIPDSLSLLCDTLVELDLSSNQLIGSLPTNFTECVSLKLLDLGSNQLSGDFVATIISGGMPKSPLHGSNLLDGDIMPDLCLSLSLPMLRKLILPNNYLSGRIPPSLSHCANLQVIDLSFNLLVGPIPAQVLQLPKLVDLVLCANSLSGEIPDMLCSNGTALETLVMSYNNFTGSIPPSIIRCVNLNWLSLASNQLTGSVPLGFSNLQKLGILQLYKNSLSGFIPEEELGRCNNLICLDLNSNYFTGTIPPQFVARGAISGKRFAFLRNEGGNICPGAGLLFEFLDIRPQRLAESQAAKFCPSARIYVGTTAYLFRSNGSMVFLDLSYNGLTGTIPASLGSMLYLHELNLGHNDLTGAIPDAFSGLKSIGALDLSHNHLNGTIPPGIGALSFLADFDVSNNNLT